jgi:enoyl-CoA hydratase/carnithine racemase
MWHNLSKIFIKLSHDPNVRSIVLTGAGERAFTAGLDVQVCMHSLPSPLLSSFSLPHNT